MLKKSWGIILWGLIFLFLGWQTFDVQTYLIRGVQGRTEFFNAEVPQYSVKIEQLKKNTANAEIQKQLPYLENELSTRLNTYASLLTKAKLMTKFLFPLTGILLLATGLGLIFRIEMARKIAGVSAIMLMFGSLYIMHTGISFPQDGGRLGKIDSAINCYLENKPSLEACAAYLTNKDSKIYLDAYLPIALTGILFLGVVFWYFSRKKIKEQFR